MKKIAVIGTCDSYAGAPFSDPSWEIWGVGTKRKHVTRADKWFEIHALDCETKEFQDEWRKHLKEYFKGDGTEIVMLFPEPDLGNVTLFPAEKIAKKYGTFFLTSTFAWMMALAIEEGADEIGVYGCDMEYGEEYKEQRAGVRHFIDLARVLGIKVTRPLDSGIAFEPVPYPMYLYDPLLQKLKFRSKVQKDLIKYYKESLQDTKILIGANHSMMAEARASKKKNYDADAKIEKYQKEITGLEKTTGNIKSQLKAEKATEEEQDWFLGYLTA